MPFLRLPVLQQLQVFRIDLEGYFGIQLFEFFNETVFIFEFRDGRVATETAYWSEAFPPPEWRSKWVEIG